MKIEKSQEWIRIDDRLCAIMKIDEILDSNFSIYRFSPKKLSFHSTIAASYLIYSETYREGVFLFLVKIKLSIIANLYFLPTHTIIDRIRQDGQCLKR